jgi:LysR family transcriptional activator of nhaA
MISKINYNHLYYFHIVAKWGSVTRASGELRLAQSTVSAQLKALEDVLGEKLFEKHGRNIKLTETGEIAQRYCKQIFDLGEEMYNLIEGNVTGRPEVIRIGIADTLPKLLAYRVLEPIYDSPIPPRLDIREGSAEKLLAELAIHTVDAVILDCPIPPSVNVRAYNHLLGECGVSFLCSVRMADQVKGAFPKSLEQLDLLLPSTAAAVRTEIDSWIQKTKLNVKITGEFQDSALLKIFGRHGRGVFPVPTLIEKEVCREMHCKVIGRITAPIERYYLITTQRRLSNPNLARLTGLSETLSAEG